MCGIAGIWNFDGQPVPQRTIDRFTDSLAHRGPDGRGVWKDDHSGIALGHRRLAILDLTDKGKQPMPYMNGRYWITYNGEVYNFLEIRKELEDKGYRFRSQSDTEVILASYHEWGSDMLIRFNGMWAMAIYDTQRQELFLARDRFGIKPLHYLLTPQQLAFASELKSFKRLEGFPPEIDTETAQVLLQNAFTIEGTTRTLVKRVRRLQGGHYAVVKNRQVVTTRWWNTLDHLIEVPETLEAQADRFRELFFDAVKIRMRSDVPISTCLSGGFDSTAVACAMSEISRNNGSFQRMAPDWQHAFVATFPGAYNDERPQAEEAVRFAGLQPHFLPITESEALTDIDTVLHDFEDVYIGLPTAVWLIYRELRRHQVVVSLDGHGADELLGGYKQVDFLLFHEAPSWLYSPLENIRLLKQYYSLLPEPMRPKGGFQKWKQTAHIQIVNHPNFRHLYGTIKLLRKLTVWGHVNGFLRTKPPKQNKEFEMVGISDVLPKDWGPINRELYNMFHSTVLPTILRNFDRMSMAHGVEVRMPFMDYRLVTFVMSLPDTSKIAGGQTKQIAREAMRDRMPESIRVSKTKIGFNSPMPEWLEGPLQGWVNKLVNSANSQEHMLIDCTRLKNLVVANTEKRKWSWYNCSVPWTYLHYLWFEKHFLKHE